VDKTKSELQKELDVVRSGCEKVMSSGGVGMMEDVGTQTTLKRPVKATSLDCSELSVTGICKYTLLLTVLSNAD